MRIQLTTKWLARLDDLTHWLNKNLGIPVVHRICDAYDKRLLESCPADPFYTTTTSSTAGNVQITLK